MESIKNIELGDWPKLMMRPNIENEKLTDLVSSILKTVKSDKDKALKKYTQQFDKVNLDSLVVSSCEIKNAISLVSEELKQAIHVAKENIEKFHLSQKIVEEIVETSSGVICWRKSVAIEKVGLYIPGGLPHYFLPF